MRTVLPEKWYVVRTPENAQELNDWADSVVKDPEAYDRPHTKGYVYWNGLSFSIKASVSAKKITYEEFTKLVLKKGV